MIRTDPLFFNAAHSFMERDREKTHRAFAFKVNKLGNMREAYRTNDAQFCIEHINENRLWPFVMRLLVYMFVSLMMHRIDGWKKERARVQIYLQIEHAHILQKNDNK